MATALFFCCLTAVATEPHYFPGTTIALEDGDIVLNDAVGASSVFNRTFGMPAGPYTHASVYIEFPGKEGKLVSFSDKGVQISDPDAMLKRNFLLALLRPVTPPPSGQLAKAFEALSARPLRFNYSMSWPALESALTYCAGFISQLYRLAGLDQIDPFPAPQASKSVPGFMDTWAKQHLDMDLQQIVSPNAPLFNARFRLLAERQALSRFKAEKLLIQQSVLKKVTQYLAEDGFVFQALKPGSQLVFYLANAGILDGITLAGMPRQHVRYFLQIHELMVRVEERVRRSVRLSDEAQWSDEALQALAEEVTDAYCDEFFVSAPTK